MSASLKTTQSEAQSRSLLPTAIGFGMVGFYALFTLLPNSNSLMVKWPWVFLWQFGLMLCPIALLFQLWQGKARRLGGWLDWLAGAGCIVLTLSAAFAEFKHQAFWYSWAALCGIAALYAINNWLTTPDRVQRLLAFQGGLTVVFSLSSLVAWYFQTVRPYLNTLEELKGYGIERILDLQIIPLRNWHPIGHQNYVAGYLVLVIPLLIGLAFAHGGVKRISWLMGALVSLATLYSTASRGGWLGLVASAAVFIGLSIWQYPKFRKALVGAGIVSFGIVVFWGFSSDRIRTLFSSFSADGSGGELLYRAITNVTGWHIGLAHPILGAGLGSVALLYQKYRPEWAGREAELTYQLHSTPAQLWAELGLAGTLLTLISLAAVAYLSIRWCKGTVAATERQVIASPLVTGVISGLAGYSVYAITDYQLDNICISGALVIFLSVLVFENRSNLKIEETVFNDTSAVKNKTAKRIALAGTGVLTAISLWLYPIHKAWMLSSQGFLALQQQDVASFVDYLEKSNKLAPWEPYYAYQLAWNLGDLAYKSEDAQQQEKLRQESIQWFEKANAISPNQEFGYSNLGWLQVNSNPQQATQNFLKATQLVPEKRGAFFALGYSLLKEGKQKEALQAMLTELFQQPVFLTSPIWQSPELASFYPQVMASFENELNQKITDSNEGDSKLKFYQILGSLKWWQGDFDQARLAFEQAPTPLNEAMLALAKTKPGEKVEVEVSEETAVGSVIAAWQHPENRMQFFRKSILLSIPSDFVPELDDINRATSQLKDSMKQTISFHNWITQKAITHQERNQRLGFGTISRHIDGSIPSDFLIRLENGLQETLLQMFFPSNLAPIDSLNV